MPNILVDFQLPNDNSRRELIYGGDILLDTCTPASRALIELARDMLDETFSGKDPERAQYAYDVQTFISMAGPLKSKFTNHPRTKALVQQMLAACNCDMEKTYFDVPRLRIATSDGYLSAGVGYAYKAHRDTWYSSPQQQINWWLPVFDLEAGRSLVMYPSYWTKPIENSSADFDYDEWCQVGRQLATTQVKTDTRKHPVPLEPLAEADEARIVCTAGSCLLFSGAHLHATAPNDTGVTRFSMDFRTVHLDDLLEERGAPNVDCEATGTTLGDFLRVSDLAPLPPQVVARHRRRSALQTA